MKKTNKLKERLSAGSALLARRWGEEGASVGGRGLRGVPPHRKKAVAVMTSQSPETSRCHALPRVMRVL